MPDYVYLLENRLSPAQQGALLSIRTAARESGMTVFLTGGAVRDLTSGSPVRDLDVSVQGNALDLKTKLQEAGAVLWGEHKPSQSLFARFPGSVRVEVSSTRREEFPKPGKPVYHPGSILEDLRRRDFTANAMALSLNEGSYGLLMDPLNGVADLEARLLRLVSNYGFLEDPIRLVRASRLRARMGWELEEKTQVRFDNAKGEGVISLISPYQQGYEVEEIVHEEDGLKILKALESEGWMKALFPAWTSAKVDAEALDNLRETLVQLQMQGVNPDPSAAQAQLLTAKLAAKDLAALKKLFARRGFVDEWESQEERAKEVGKRLIGKETATPSAAWKLLTSTDPEAVLWLGLTGKSAPVQEKFKDFFALWPESRSRIPYALMQEMRITPDLDGYQDLVKSIFFELIDGKLTSEEEMRQFLEPHSPPAPPPPVTIRRTRAKKGAGKQVEAREIDEDDEPSPRSESDEESGDDLDDEADSGDERGELIARSALPPLRESPPPPISSLVSAAVLNSEEVELPVAPAPIPPVPVASPVPSKPVAKPAALPSAPAAIETPQPSLEPKAEAAVAPSSKPAKAVESAPSKSSEAKSAPAKSAPVKTAAVGPLPSKAILAKSSPEKSSSSNSAPAKKAPPKTVPVKAAPMKAVAGKSAASRPVAKPAPSLKKAELKKPAAKPAVGGKKIVAKPLPAKAVVKAKPAAGKSGSPIQAKAAKQTQKPAAAKKKR
jgi:tRNA nucleotidyltransferase/poly(A) polymerase